MVGWFQVRRKDGSRFPALVTDSGVYHGGALVGIVGVSTNLGVALRPLLERSTDAALVLRSDAVITDASPAVHQLFGWQDELIIGRSITTLLHPEDAPALGRFLQQLLAEPGAHPPLQLRVRRDDGWVWAEAALTNLWTTRWRGGWSAIFGSATGGRRRNRPRSAPSSCRRPWSPGWSSEQGFLAGRDGITPEAAFEQMRSHARNNQLAIRVVARRVIAGDLLTPAP